MSKQRMWTEDEEIYLEYYIYDGEKNYAAAAEFLGRSLMSVQHKARELRIKNENVKYIKRPYSVEEVKFLKETYKKLPVKLIAQRLRRSENSVVQKAWELGLKKKESLVEYDDVIKMLAKEGCHRSEIARKLNLSTSSVHKYIKRNNIQCEYAPVGFGFQKWKESHLN